MIAIVNFPPSRTAACVVTATAEATAVAVVSVAASLASDKSRLDTAWTGTVLCVTATGVETGGGGGDDTRGATAAAAAGD